MVKCKMLQNGYSVELMRELSVEGTSEEAPELAPGDRMLRVRRLDDLFGSHVKTGKPACIRKGEIRQSNVLPTK